jgi:membrane-bound serine protease (ClpP class)
VLRRLALLTVVWSAWALCAPAVAASAVVVDVRGAVGVGTVMAVDRALEVARSQRSALLVIRLDTPGGLVSATRDLVQRILASPIPVAIYVAPGGARAASAGTYLAYAAHLAVMAPGTNLGAATPIRLGSPGGPKPRDEPEQDAAPAGDDALERKTVNDAVAYLRGLAQLRGRNAQWAEKAVREAATLTASEAASQRVIDFVAADVPELLAKAHGRTVRVGTGMVTLDTRDAPVVEVETGWRARLIAFITNPDVAFFLLLVGLYGLAFEFLTPGTVGPGVIGAIALLLALAALSMLPVNAVGVALLLLGIGLMAAEALTPGFGVLGLGGIAAFVAGGLFLFDSDAADIDFRVAWPVVLSAAATSAALFAFVLGAAIRARKQRPATDREAMVHETGDVIRWNGLGGTVRVHGEVWSARADAPLSASDAIEVVARDGLTLIVRRRHVEGDRHA